MTRNADISFDDEKFEDNEENFRRQMTKLLKQRDHLAVVRLELSTPVSAEFQKILSMLVRVQTHQVFVDSITPGKHADFIVLGENPVKNIRTLGHVEQVYKDGMLVSLPPIDQSCTD